MSQIEQQWFWKIQKRIWLTCLKNHFFTLLFGLTIVFFSEIILCGILLFFIHILIIAQMAIWINAICLFGIYCLFKVYCIDFNLNHKLEYPSHFFKKTYFDRFDYYFLLASFDIPLAVWQQFNEETIFFKVNYFYSSFMFLDKQIKKKYFGEFSKISKNFSFSFLKTYLFAKNSFETIKSLFVFKNPIFNDPLACYSNKFEDIYNKYQLTRDYQLLSHITKTNKKLFKGNTL